MLTGLLIAKAAVVALGLIVALQGYRAAKREGSQRMLVLAGGFTILSVGSVLEGICYGVFQLSALQSGIIQTTFVGLGMSMIVLSLFIPGAAVTRGRSDVS